ncbi:MAG: amidohydrolase family protein [Myxococcales bacterium]|nr:amidohydrolase family protein [Myxococcales bacterium]
MLDIKITGGTIIDGTGAEPRRADVGIRDGRLVAIGEVDEDARETIDATGEIVCPGFIDVHTHYDAQVFWDGTLSPSSNHGVTTVFAGNCGFSIAPLSPEAGSYLMRMLARVEGMPLESLQEGVPWDWKSFGEYLAKLDGNLSINAGFMVGHSAIRRVVMGERAVGHEASADELEQMKQLLSDSLAEGGIGFSSTISVTHNDAEGEPVPSRHASREELVELARVCSNHEGTALEFLPGVPPFNDDQKRLMADLSLAANRPLNWNVLIANGQDAALNENQLDASDFARSQGAEVLALTVPQSLTVRLNFVTGFVLDALNGWDEFFKHSIEERKAILADPVSRKELAEKALRGEGVMANLARWERMTIHEAFTPATKQYEGRTVGEIAAEQGAEPFDALVEILLADDLRTSLMPASFGEDEESWQLRGRLWKDDRTIIGASDAGAHLDMIDTFAQTTQVLGRGVREFGLLSLEEAIHQLTQVPAELYGMRERGVLREGWIADVTVFDAETVGTGPTYTRADLPAGASRLYADANGIQHVFVNGVQVIRDGKHTEARPGTVLHSGRDTYSVTVPGGSSA